MRREAALAAAFCCAAALGCSSGPRPAAGRAGSGTGSTTNANAKATSTATSNTTSKSLAAGTLLARAEAAWSKRDDPAELDEAIRLWEQAAQHLPAPAEALTAAARGRRLRIERAVGTADEVLEAVSQDARVCADDAHRAWSASPSERPLREVLARIDARGAEPLYLEAVCMAAWARAQGFTPLVDRREELQQMLERVSQLAPQLDEAGAEREMGKLLAALPTYAGGDLGEARTRFETAVARSPRSARNRIAFARTVAVKAQDRTLFEEQLNSVLDFGNEDETAAAKELLARENELFGPSEAAQPIPGGPTR